MPSIDEQLSAAARQQRPLTLDEQLTQAHKRSANKPRPERTPKRLSGAATFGDRPHNPKALDVSPIVCVRTDSPAADQNTPKRRAPPRSTHLSVAQIVKKGSEPVVEEDTPAQPVFDASALREVLNAARNGERERVHALALSLRSVIDVQPRTHLASMAHHALNNALCAACASGHARQAAAWAMGGVGARVTLHVKI